ncbi:MAG: tRNA lysidine(34) synthetase TilS [Synergistaceae bacterium]|nr:tRNA lysidine(34) synthetase TilS [Synergistaceae bacterium]
MALLWFFATFWKKGCIAAHLEHGIRGEASRKDAQFVEKLAGEWGIPFRGVSLCVPDLLQQGESLEEGARRLRYEFFEEVRLSSDAWGTATAHTSDDAAETFLLNLLRGSGPRGLTGIPERRERIFRPLLQFSREFLRKLLKLHHVPWREDETNEDPSYLRNKVRHQLLPLLREEYNKGIKRHLLALAGDMEILREREEDLFRSLESLGRRALPMASFSCSLAFLRSLRADSLSLFFRGVGRKLGLKTLDRVRTENLAHLVRTSSRWCFQWQGNMFVFCSSRCISWVMPDILMEHGSASSFIPLSGAEGVFTWKRWSFHWKKEQTDRFFLGETQALLPFEEEILLCPLTKMFKGRKSTTPWWLEPHLPVLRCGERTWTPWSGERYHKREDRPCCGLRIFAREIRIPAEEELGNEL